MHVRFRGTLCLTAKQEVAVFAKGQISSSHNVQALWRKVMIFIHFDPTGLDVTNIYTKQKLLVRKLQEFMHRPKKRQFCTSNPNCLTSCWSEVVAAMYFFQGLDMIQPPPKFRTCAIIAMQGRFCRWRCRGHFSSAICDHHKIRNFSLGLNFLLSFWSMCCAFLRPFLFAHNNNDNQRSFNILFISVQGHVPTFQLHSTGGHHRS